MTVFPYSLLISNVDGDRPEKPEYGPEKAIDNNLSTIYYSKEEFDRWYPSYRITLANPSQVHYVVIANRNTNGYKFQDAEVRVGYTEIYGVGRIKENTVCGTYQGPAQDGKNITIKCDGFIEGKYVSIQLGRNHPLHFAEVEVFGQGKY